MKHGHPHNCDHDQQELAQRFAALAHPARLRIMAHLAKGEGHCCGDVVSCLDLAQSTVSQHLRILVEAGLVHYVSEGQRSRYSINADAIRGLRDRFDLFAGACCGTGSLEIAGEDSAGVK
jgi:DNA-binding transcriptional ArsR family regulator